MPPYNATVTQRLIDADLVILGKTNMDEFAMGSSTENSAYGPTHNPWDLDRIPGGSGGGSSAALAAFEAPLAIGTDTGGSIRQPASVTGTVGVKPTYGGTSRYGLVAMASSLDQAGPCARTVLDAALLHAGDRRSRPDGLDLDRRAGARRGRCRPVRRRERACKIGVVSELGGEGYAPGVEQRFNEAVELLAWLGAEIVEVSCPHFVYALPAYYLIMPSEVSSNLAKFDAMRFGLRVGDDGTLRCRAGDGGDPRGRLRCRGEAPDHDRHVRLVQRLLRRLLRPGPEGPHPDQARLRRRVRLGRRAGLPVDPDHGVQDRGEGRRSAGDVPQRPVHHPLQPGRQRQRVVPDRPGPRGRAAGRAAGDGAATGRRPALPGRRRSGAGTGLDAGVARCSTRSQRLWRWPDDRRSDAVRRGAGPVRPGPRARGARRAEHGLEDVLRLLDHLRGRARTPRPARSASACPARCRWSTPRPSSRRSGSGWR